MTHEELQDQLELYVLGVLDADETAAIDAHLLSGCTRCTQALGRATAVNAAMLAVAPEAVPAPGLRDKVMARVSPARRQIRSPFWLAIAASLAAAVVWLVAERQSDRDELAALQEARAAADAEAARLTSTLEFLQDPETRPATAQGGAAQQPRGTYFINQRGGVLLIASNLQPIGPDKVFELWVIPREGAPQPAGTFRADDTGAALHLFRDAAAPASARALAITVEPVGGSAAPTTTPMLVTPVAAE
jgi:anti-sigma-K factor RskA